MTIASSANPVEVATADQIHARYALKLPVDQARMTADSTLRVYS